MIFKLVTNRCVGHFRQLVSAAPEEAFPTKWGRPIKVKPVQSAAAGLEKKVGGSRKVSFTGCNEAGLALNALHLGFSRSVDELLCIR